MPKRVFITTKERETFLRSILNKEVGIVRESSGPDNYLFVVDNGDGTITAMDITIRRIAEWPSNVKLGGRKQIF